MLGTQSFAALFTIWRFRSSADFASLRALSHVCTDIVACNVYCYVRICLFFSVAKIEAGIVTAKERLADYFKARAATYKYGSTMAKFFQQVDKPKAVLPGGSQRGKK